MYMLLIEGKTKPGKRAEFSKTWSSQILPALKKQSGFVDEILVFSGDGTEGCGLCFWQTQQDAERYHRETFPKIKGFVDHLLNGPPKVRGFEVEASETFGIAAGKAA